MAFNIVDMLRGDIVQRQQPQQNSSAGLGEMLSYLMQGTNQPVAKVPEQAQYWNPPSLSEIAQVSANRRQEKQQEDSFAKLQELIGTKGTPGNNIPIPFRGAVLPTKGTGLRGGVSLEDFAIGLAGVPDKVLAAQGFDMITNLSKPQAKPTLHSMGVPNKPGYKVNFYLDDNNQPVPVGEPYKADGGININTGAGSMGNLLSDDQKIKANIPVKDVAQFNQSGGISIVKSAPAPVELKDWQRKDLDFVTRMMQADKVLSEVGTNYDPAYVKAARYVENTPILGDIANAAISENDQRVLQAQRQFLNSVLRPESGAVIGDTEFASGVKQYFPQPNESKKIQEQKANARRTAIEGLKLGIPPEFLPKTDYGSYSPSTGGGLKSAEQYLMENQ